MTMANVRNKLLLETVTDIENETYQIKAYLVTKNVVPCRRTIIWAGEDYTTWYTHEADQKMIGNSEWFSAPVSL